MNTSDIPENWHEGFLNLPRQQQEKILGFTSEINGLLQESTVYQDITAHEEAKPDDNNMNNWHIPSLSWASVQQAAAVAAGSNPNVGTAAATSLNNVFPNGNVKTNGKSNTRTGNSKQEKKTKTSKNGKNKNGKGKNSSLKRKQSQEHVQNDNCDGVNAAIHINKKSNFTRTRLQQGISSASTFLNDDVSVLNLESGLLNNNIIINNNNNNGTGISGGSLLGENDMNDHNATLSHSTSSAFHQDGQQQTLTLHPSMYDFTYRTIPNEHHKQGMAGLNNMITTVDEDRFSDYLLDDPENDEIEKSFVGDSQQQTLQANILHGNIHGGLVMENLHTSVGLTPGSMMGMSSVATANLLDSNTVSMSTSTASSQELHASTSSTNLAISPSFVPGEHILGAMEHFNPHQTHSSAMISFDPTNIHPIIHFHDPFMAHEFMYQQQQWAQQQTMNALNHVQNQSMNTSNSISTNNSVNDNINNNMNNNNEINRNSNQTSNTISSLPSADLLHLSMHFAAAPAAGPTLPSTNNSNSNNNSSHHLHPTRFPIPLHPSSQYPYSNTPLQSLPNHLPIGPLEVPLQNFGLKRTVRAPGQPTNIQANDKVDRKTLKRLRNRVSASRCRVKKKVWLQDLEERHVFLKQQHVIAQEGFRVLHEAVIFCRLSLHDQDHPHNNNNNLQMQQQQQKQK